MLHKTPLKWETHIKYGLLITSILFGWGIREYHRVAPKLTQAVNQAKEYSKVDIHGHIGGCIPFDVKGVL
jgi:hypothetical protein